MQPRSHAQPGKADGKTTIFNAITGSVAEVSAAQVQYVDIGGMSLPERVWSSSMDELLKLLHPVDALVHVVRNFDRSGEPPRMM